MSECRRCAIAATFIALFAIVAESRSDTIDEYRSFVKTSMLRTVFVRAQPTQAQGTGVLVRWTSDGQKTVLVTNKHVLEGAQRLYLIVQLSDSAEGKHDTLQTHVPLLSDAGDTLFATAADGLDIACIVMPPTPHMIPPGWNIACVPNSAFCSYRDLYLTERVIYSGFPDSQHANEFDPLVRSGFIAAIDSLHKRILVEAQAFGGSSGSPVFVDPANVAAATPAFVGVVAGFLQSPPQCLIESQTKELRMILRENSGLAVVMPACEIALVAENACDLHRMLLEGNQ